MSNFSIRRRSRGRLAQSLAPGGVKRTCAMTGSSKNPITTSMVYPPPLNNRASVACIFEDATRIRAAEKGTFSWISSFHYASPMTRRPQLFECSGGIGNSFNFGEAFRKRTPCKYFHICRSATIRWQLKSQQMRILLSVLGRIFFEQFRRP
jgi:hypothetical protein